MAVNGIRPGHFPSKAARASRQPWVTAPSIRCPGALRWLFGFAAWAARPAARRSSMTGDTQPQQLHQSIIAGEMPAGLDDFPQLPVE